MQDILEIHRLTPDVKMGWFQGASLEGNLCDTLINMMSKDVFHETSVLIFHYNSFSHRYFICGLNIILSQKLQVPLFQYHAHMISQVVNK